jgi:hypothetical protein
VRFNDTFEIRHEEGSITGRLGNRGLDMGERCAFAKIDSIWVPQVHAVVSPWGERRRAPERRGRMYHAFVVFFAEQDAAARCWPEKFHAKLTKLAFRGRGTQRSHDLPRDNKGRQLLHGRMYHAFGLLFASETPKCNIIIT